MPTVHFLNVGKGDCSVIQHGSGRISVIDICNGKTSIQRAFSSLIEKQASVGGISGNFRMCHHPTDPVQYIKRLVGTSKVFRFILTHPDMDHMDGFKALFDEIGMLNFWDSGVRKEKPDFEGSPYKEEDWDCYVKVRDGKAGVTVVTPRSGSIFRFANDGDPDGRGDCLDVLAPTPSLIQAANDNGDSNDASYVLVYRTCGGKIVFPGDAHDDTWNHVITEYADKVANCSVLIAPHHGRASDRSYEFLDTLQPKLTLFGCAPSKDLAYSAWRNRGLYYITNNQAGNILLSACNEGIDVYVENRTFAERHEAFDAYSTLNGCYFIGRIPKD